MNFIELTGYLGLLTLLAVVLIYLVNVFRGDKENRLEAPGMSILTLAITAVMILLFAYTTIQFLERLTPQ